MVKCLECDYDFTSIERLNKHRKKYSNCSNKCSRCLHKFSSLINLKKHKTIKCKKRYECIKCKKSYSSGFRLKKHICNSQKIENNQDIIIDYNPKQKQVNAIQEIIDNNPNRNIVINNYYDNSKINNVEIKDNKIQNVQNNIQNNQVNFLKTTPRNFNFDYNVSEALKQRIPEFIKMDGYEEDIADKYMYEVEEYEKLSNEIKNKYNKEPINTKGMIEFFKELQKDEKNRNVIIQKSKSGKCYVFEFTKWKEKDLKETIPNIYKKLCDNMHDIETSLNHYLRENIKEKPKRFTELKKAVENEILQLSKIKYELDQIKEIET